MNVSAEMKAFLDWMFDWEGRKVHIDPDDRGGQTCWGIARNYHPDWPGWKLIDAGITSGPELEALIYDFYSKMFAPYWGTMGPRLREAFCDALVNMGTGKPGDKEKGAVELLQHSMNRIAGVVYVKVDGDYGKNTKFAVSRLDPSCLAFTICAFRLSEYGMRGKTGGYRRKYLDGWNNRVTDLMNWL